MENIDINDYPEDLQEILEELMEEADGSRGAVYEHLGSGGTSLLYSVLNVVPLLKDHPKELRSLLQSLVG